MTAREKAVFCFTIYEKGAADESRSILSKIVPVAATMKSFPRFMAYIETPEESVARVTINTEVYVGDQPGSIAYLKESEVNEWLSRKMKDEDRARKQPGHVSYRPAMVLPTSTCVIVIGSRKFCASIANVHMVEIVELQRKLNTILTKLLGLVPYQRRARLSRDDLFIVDVNQDPKNYITYNLCWMFEHVQRASEIVGVITFSEPSAPREIE